MNRSIPCLILTATLLAGCAAEVGGAAVTYTRGNATTPPIRNVDQPGLYELFPGTGINPLEGASVYLSRGDQYGFTSRAGKTVGIFVKAGQTQIVPLDGVLTSDYSWKYEGDKQR